MDVDFVLCMFTLFITALSRLKIGLCIENIYQMQKAAKREIIIWMISFPLIKLFISGYSLALTARLCFKPAFELLMPGLAG